SEYERGLYYGEKLYREQERIFYVNDGRYTTCDADEPHFHFHSKNMKLIEGEKLIARPVVFYIERIPLLAIPYYVFPLKRGRHSGFLPFTFGKFERGDRYVKNVGYYWAASEYWDWQGSFDYHEKSQNLTFSSRVNFRKRYVLDGYVLGSYLRDANYDRFSAAEFHRDRYVIKGAYNHIVSPSFNVNAYGDFVSDKTYYSDFSLHSEDLLNRSIKSQVSFSKRFGTNTSLSGNASHTVNLDDESRVDDLPTARLSLPTIWPFGSGRLNEEGKLERSWYHGFSLRYSPTFRNYSSRVTVEDTVIVVDGDSTVITHRSRRKWAKIEHNPSLNLPALKLGNYLNIVPGFRYSETWFKISQTDQSLAAGIDATTTYRTYSYSTGVSANTTLYGTVYPGIAGLVGLRHVLNPSVSYSYSPDIDRHPGVRAFAGGGAGSRKSQVLSFRLQQSFQAKVKSGEIERNLELLSLTSGFSYNLEEDDRPYSSLSTTYQSRALGPITIDGSMTHSFYKPGTDSLHFWSPFLLDFNFNAHFNIGGTRFLFDESETARTATDSAGRLSPTAPRSASRGRGWSFSASYRYSESGRDQNWVKRSFIDFRLAFNLTPTTSISYSQYYDFNQKLTVRNSVNIVKTIHCWTGSLYWVPIGSNRGFGFKLFVSALPEIKIDNKHDSFLQTVRR
ncbi:MAG: putative LPS assembly protein LptD, partial [candidate division Zixibacteria bacterium]|nr:putative LPS assembly protein LptD [candidate division Zixibacteria bacterium]